MHSERVTGHYYVYSVEINLRFMRLLTEDELTSIDSMRNRQLRPAGVLFPITILHLTTLSVEYA